MDGHGGPEDGLVGLVHGRYLFCFLYRINRGRLAKPPLLRLLLASINHIVVVCFCFTILLQISVIYLELLFSYVHPKFLSF